MGKKKIATYFAGADITRRIAMILIIGAMLTVAFFVVYKAINTPEKVVKDRITAYTREYYEEYYYEKTKASIPEANFESVMRQYTERGINDGYVTLRQLMLYDGGRFSSELNAISDYCDLDKTYVEIFPTKPYGKTDYRTNYKYSCNF